MNVKELLETSLLKNAKVLAGHEGLHRDISWCAPDTALRFNNWLMPGLLLLFTGKQQKYGWDQYMEKIIEHQPAAILIFDAWNQEGIFPEKYNLNYFDSIKLPLIVLQKSTNPLAFTKRIGALLSESFSTDRRTEEWLQDICYSGNAQFDSSLAISLGYVSGFQYYCILVEMRKVDSENPLFVEMDMLHAKGHLTEALGNMPSFRLPPCLSFIENNTVLVCFAPFPLDKESQSKISFFILSAAKRVREQMSHRKWSFCVGSPASDFCEFAESFRTAQQTANIVRTLKAYEPVSFYENWYMHMLLLQEPKTRLSDYMRRTLAPILENTDYVNTLSDYLTFGENLKVTAEHLHIHTNTLKYRLNKISELLNVDLTNPNVRFRLRMVITIYRYLQNT